MKITREFIYAKKAHKDGGVQEGWLLHDKPHFDPVSSRPHVLVHDIMEHTNYDGDTFEDELMALGATYFFRVYGGWTRFLNHWEGERGHWVQHSDIFQFLRMNEYKVKPIKGDVHPDLDYYMALSERKVRRQTWNNPDPEVYQRNPGLIRDVFKWISRGYVRAMNQWAGHDAETVYQKVWEPMWHALGGHPDLQRENESNIDQDWKRFDNHMIVTVDTVTLEWSIDFTGQSITESQNEFDDLIRQAQAA